MPRIKKNNNHDEIETNETAEVITETKTEAEAEVTPEAVVPEAAMSEQPEQESGQSPEQLEQPEPKSEYGLTMKELNEKAKRLAALLADTTGTFANELEKRDERLNGHDGDLKNHEQRIAALELRRAEPVQDASVGVESAPVKGVFHNRTGPGLAWKYWDFQNRSWGITTDIWKAAQIWDQYKGVYVWYENGQIDHILSNDELVKYIY